MLQKMVLQTIQLNKNQMMNLQKNQQQQMFLMILGLLQILNQQTLLLHLQQQIQHLLIQLILVLLPSILELILLTLM